MTVLIWNLLLAVGWMALIGRFTPEDLIVGLVLGYLVLFWFGRGVMRPTGYFAKTRQVVTFAWFFVKELVLANLRVAHDVLTPKHHMRPGIVAIPLDATSDLEITLLANLVTLTPGSMSLDVSEDRKTLYVHVMYIDDLESARNDIKSGFERRTLELLR